LPRSYSRGATDGDTREETNKLTPPTANFKVNHMFAARIKKQKIGKIRKITLL
jgi:hypothetical protein